MKACIGWRNLKITLSRKKVLTRLDIILRSSPIFDTLRKWGDEGNEKMEEWRDGEMRR
jgi:hypothetical protein